jgi:hypothetical protein
MGIFQELAQKYDVVFLHKSTRMYFPPPGRF